MRRTEDGAVPVAHGNVIAVSQTDRACLCSALAWLSSPERASLYCIPAPSPFSPFSSSSSRRKFLGIFAAIMGLQLGGNWRFTVVWVLWEWENASNMERSATAVLRRW